MHNAGVKPYACPVCGCRFHLLHNMKRHIHTHEDQGDIEAGTAEGLIQAWDPRKLETYSGWCPFKGLSNDTTLMQIQSGRTVPLSVQLKNLPLPPVWELETRAKASRQKKDY